MGKEWNCIAIIGKNIVYNWSAVQCYNKQITMKRNLTRKYNDTIRIYIWCTNTTNM